MNSLERGDKGLLGYVAGQVGVFVYTIKDKTVDRIGEAVKPSDNFFFISFLLSNIDSKILGIIPYFSFLFSKTVPLTETHHLFFFKT